MDADELDAVDIAILDALRDGRSTKGHLVDVVKAHRNTVWRHLQLLEEGGHVECVHEGTRLYALKNDPREN